MTTKEAPAEIFWTAFKALPKPEQEAIVARLLGDKELVEDLTDVALSEHARCEPGSVNHAARLHRGNEEG